MKVLGFRDVPTDNSCLGDIARNSEPVIKQIFIDGQGRREEELERRLYVARKRAEAPRDRKSWAIRPNSSTFLRCPAARFATRGCSSRRSLFAYYPDLADERVRTALAIVHQRYSTNTFPSWRLAQPFRMIAHNGEINTLRGNANACKATSGRCRRRC